MNSSETLLCPNEEKALISENDKSTILFICTGNTCRSPMAAALFNHICAGGTRHAVSAGISADGSPIAEYACEALMKRGVLPTPDNNYPRHISRNPEIGDIEKAELIIGVTASHATALMMKYPAYATKISAMPEDIPDPFGGTQQDYDRCLVAIEKGLTEAFCTDVNADSSPESTGNMGTNDKPDCGENPTNGG